VNVFTAPGKATVGERPKPFGEAGSALTRSRRLNLRRARRGAGGRNGTVAEAEALADWVALHNRNLSNTVAIEVPLMKQWGQKPEF